MERKLKTEVSLGDLTWFPSGGSVGTFLQPAHMADLGEFLRDLATETEVHVLGSGSNTLFSGDRFDGVVVYLGERFGGFEILPDRSIRAGAGALTAEVAKSAMAQGLDITFLGAVPGTIGGAIAGNAGFLGKNICAKWTILGNLSNKQGMNRKTPFLFTSLNLLNFSNR